MNEEILEESKVEPVDEKPRRYKSDWLRQVTRIKNNRMPKIMLDYRQNGRKRL
jgi:DNA primase